jgi:hypothetical protein
MPETALWPSGVTAHRLGGLRPSAVPVDTSRHTPLQTVVYFIPLDAPRFVHFETKWKKILIHRKFVVWTEVSLCAAVPLSPAVRKGVVSWGWPRGGGCLYGINPWNEWRNPKICIFLPFTVCQQTFIQSWKTKSSYSVSSHSIEYCLWYELKYKFFKRFW